MASCTLRVYIRKSVPHKREQNCCLIEKRNKHINKRSPRTKRRKIVAGRCPANFLNKLAYLRRVIRVQTHEIDGGQQRQQKKGNDENIVCEEIAEEPHVANLQDRRRTHKISEARQIQGKRFPKKKKGRVAAQIGQRSLTSLVKG